MVHNNQRKILKMERLSRTAAPSDLFALFANPFDSLPLCMLFALDCTVDWVFKKWTLGWVSDDQIVYPTLRMYFAYVYKVGSLYEQRKYIGKKKSRPCRDRESFLEKMWTSYSSRMIYGDGLFFSSSYKYSTLFKRSFTLCNDLSLSSFQVYKLYLKLLLLLKFVAWTMKKAQRGGENNDTFSCFTPVCVKRLAGWSN